MYLREKRERGEERVREKIGETREGRDKEEKINSNVFSI